jgi:hypothetical protein
MFLLIIFLRLIYFVANISMVGPPTGAFPLHIFSNLLSNHSLKILNGKWSIYWSLATFLPWVRENYCIFFFLYGQIIFFHVIIPWLFSNLSVDETLGLFVLFGYCKWCSHEYSTTHFCVNTFPLLLNINLEVELLSDIIIL